MLTECTIKKDVVLYVDYIRLGISPDFKTWSLSHKYKNYNHII